MQGNGLGREAADDAPDRTLWQRSRTLDLPADEAADLLDLAAFADGRLDPDESERVAERLARDPLAAADVAAARALARPGIAGEIVPEGVIARASVLVGGAKPESARTGNVIPFRRRNRPSPQLHGMTRWGSLVAAVAVASWLGFTLGVDATRSFVPAPQVGAGGYLNELVDAPNGFLGDLIDGAQT